ncbi:hypothetical protein [Lactobacillus sp. ESL0677]|uniref:hypothetical protein n=1 Tax=Lactobacillus sp. ESL0677 TaxID=2983208 RepID=UPI0023F63954|nr:hypothetical protein [Lactobacillus sp. ESL0677]WEV36272.1 hypothetical protein OZX76_05870 [Lactobacillus sp. ESL0677]
MEIKEQYMTIAPASLEELYKSIIAYTQRIESSLDAAEIMAVIKERDEIGEGLVSDDGLIIHVINRKVKQDVITYFSLSKPINYCLKSLKKSFDLDKVVLLVVNPGHQLNKPKHLITFIMNN